MFGASFPKRKKNVQGAEITRQETFAIALQQSIRVRDCLTSKTGFLKKTKDTGKLRAYKIFDAKTDKVIYTNKLFQLCFYKNTDDNKQGEN